MVNRFDCVYVYLLDLKYLFFPLPLLPPIPLFSCAFPAGGLGGLTVAFRLIDTLIRSGGRDLPNPIFFPFP